MSRLERNAHREEKSPLAAIAAFFGVIYIVGFLACREFDAFMSGMCGTTEVREVLSPDQRLKVVEYLFDCGVGSEPVRNFTVLKASETLPNEAGEAFRCDTNGDWDPAPSHSPVRLRWLNNHQIEIIYPDGLEVFGHEPIVSVSIAPFDTVQIQVVAKRLPPKMTGKPSGKDNGMQRK